MGRLIRYSLSCKNWYTVYPIVLIFAINGFSSVDIEKEFHSVSENPFLKIDSKFWAKDCLLISRSSIHTYLSRSPMDPIVALGYFLTEGSLSLDSLEYQLDPTILILHFWVTNWYKLSLDIFKSVNCPVTAFINSSKAKESSSSIISVKNLSYSSPNSTGMSFDLTFTTFLCGFTLSCFTQL